MQLEYKIDDLNKFKNYYVGVTLAAGTNRRLTSPYPIIFTTPYDKSLPPQNLNITVDNIAMTMKITWHHNCDIKGQHPSNYKVHIADLILRTAKIVDIKSNDPCQMSCTYANISQGAVYTITVSSNELENTAVFD